MRKWKVPMPREKAQPGGANVVLAFQTSGRTRVELEAKMSATDADTLLHTAIQMMKKYKEQKNG